MHHLLFIEWNPSPVAFHVPFIHLAIRWYGLLWGLSLMMCFYSTEYIFKQLKRDDEKVSVVIMYVFFGGLIGARLAHVIFYNLDYYLQYPGKIMAVWEGGLASHGGLLGGIIGLYLFCRLNKEFNFLWLLDVGSICIPALAALIRFGNLMNSELYGTVTNVPWAFIFPMVDNNPRHPVVVYESIAYLFLQFYMIYIFRKYKDSKPGLYIATLLVGLFTMRFFLEFFKQPDGAMLFNAISKTQALNIPFIITGVVILWMCSKNKLKYRTQTQISKPETV